jgi:hypothetical protein
VKFNDVQKFIFTTVSEMWTSGNPNGVQQMIILLKNKYLDTTHTFCDVLTSTGGYTGKWIQRCLAKLTFSDRKASIAQKIPKIWRSIAVEGASRVWNLFNKHKINRVFSADEKNLKFHHASNSVIAPKGKQKGGLCRQNQHN